MTFLLIAISFLSSVGISLLLRRLDRHNFRLAGIKRLGEAQTTLLQNTTREGIKNIKDATLDFEMLLRQSAQSQTELKNEIGLLQEKLESLQEDRKTIEGISGELHQIAANAATVSEQVERLDSGLTRLGYAQGEIQEIQEKIKNTDRLLEHQGQHARGRLEEVISTLIQETEERSEQLVEQIRASFHRLQEEGTQISGTIQEREEEIGALGEKISDLGEKMEERWTLETERLEGKFSGQERALRERIEAVGNGLASVRTAALHAVQAETAKIRDDLDNFNLDAISRRDEILNETRRMAEGIGDQIGTFQEKYLTAENRLLKLADDQKNFLENRLSSYQSDWEAMEEKHSRMLKEKFSYLEEELDKARNTRIDSLETEGESLREELRKRSGDFMERLEERIRETQENFRRSIREEETELQATREELAALKENLTLLGHEARASIRTEADHGLALIREARKTEEEHLTRGREELEAIQKQINTRSEELDAVLAEKTEHIQRHREELNLIFSEKTEHINRYREELNIVLAENMENIHRHREEIMQELDKKAKEFFEEQGRKIDGFQDLLREEISGMENRRTRLHEDFDRREKNYLNEREEKLERMNREIDEEITRRISQLNERTRIQVEESEQLLERMNREIDEEITRRINQMNERTRIQVDESEQRVERLIGDSAERLEGELDTVQERFRSVREDLNRELENIGKMRNEMIEEIESNSRRISEFGEKLELVNHAEELIVKLDETVEVISERLNLADEENARLDEYVRNFENLRFSRKEIESEIKLLETQRDRIDQVEKRFQEIEVRMDGLADKFNVLSRSEEIAENLENRLMKAEEYRAAADSIVVKFGDEKEYLENALQYIENSRQQAFATGQTADELLQRVERADLRQKELNTLLHRLESRTSTLNSLEGEFQKVEARFEQMEGLFLDLEEKQKQLSAMAHRTNDMKKDADIIREEMDSMLAEADEKMEKLTAFFTTIDRYVDGEADTREDDDGDRPVAVKAAAGVKRNGERGLSDIKRNGILSLYLNHKWEPELIAERMKIEPAVVRAVIASHHD